MVLTGENWSKYAVRLNGTDTGKLNYLLSSIERYWQGKTEIRREKGLSKCRLSHHKSYMFWPGIEPRPSVWLIAWAVALLPLMAYLTNFHTSAPVHLPSVWLVTTNHSHDSYTWSTCTSTVCLSTVNESWEPIIPISFTFSHMYWQSVGNRQVADVYTNALFPRCGKYEQGLDKLS